MEMLQNVFQAEVFQRVGWTLVHFVWQGVAVGVLLAIAMRMLRKSAANVRYVTACIALALIVALPAITFQMIRVDSELSTLQPKENNLTTENTTVTKSEALNSKSETNLNYQNSNFKTKNSVDSKLSTLQSINALIEPALPYVVVGWLVGVFGLSLWHLGGWTQLQRLRRRMVKDAGATLKEKAKYLCGVLGIKRAVEVVESALVNVPTVVGHLKPVILLPASAITGLSTEQIEAILAHELAHIKRCDYLVNILQTVVEILGFFHPAVWWVSNKIRIERENCCDDTAVSISGDKLCYAKALTMMEEIRGGHIGLAVAASGGSLFERIGRLVGKTTAEKERAGWLPSIIAVVLIGALVVTTAVAMSSKANKPKTLTTERTELTENKSGLTTENTENTEKKQSEFTKTLANGMTPATTLVIYNDDLVSLNNKVIYKRSNIVIPDNPSQTSDNIASKQIDFQGVIHADLGIGIISASRLRFMSVSDSAWDNLSTNEYNQIMIRSDAVQKIVFTDPHIQIRYSETSKSAVSLPYTCYFFSSSGQRGLLRITDFNSTANPSHITVQYRFIHGQHNPNLITVTEGRGFNSIIVNDPNTTMGAVINKLGQPEDRNNPSSPLLVYDRYGMRLFFSSFEIERDRHAYALTEIKIMPNFEGKLSSGITTRSSMEEVFKTYGQPIEIRESNDLDRNYADQVLFRKGNSSKIYYDKHGVMFWFKDNKIWLIDILLNNPALFNKEHPQHNFQSQNFSSDPNRQAAQANSVKSDYQSATVTEGRGFDSIIVGDPKCTTAFIISKLGQPSAIEKDTVSNGTWVDYRKQYAIDFWIDPNGVMQEIRMNPGFKGKLTSGISLDSKREDVFMIYGEPLAAKTLDDMSDNLERKDGVLYSNQSGNVSRIRYRSKGLLFWFKENNINQIVIKPIQTGQTISDNALKLSAQAAQADANSGKAKISVVGRFFTVDSNGLSVTDFLTNTLKMTTLGSTPDKDGQYGFILNAEQSKKLIKWHQSQKEARTLMAPRVLVLDGEEAKFSITTDVNYIANYKEPNKAGEKPQPVPETVTKGIIFDVTPELQSDTQAILLDMKCQQTDIVKWTKIPYKTGGKGKVPEVEIPEVVRTEGQARISVPQGQSLLLPRGIVHEEIKGKTKTMYLYMLVTAAVMPEKAEPKQQAAEQWRQKFDQVYRLDQGQILKRIAPPFIPERKEFYKQENRTQAEAIPEPPDTFTFHWDGRLKNWGMSFSCNSNNILDDVLQHALGMSYDKYEGADKLLKLSVPGDWIVRQPSSTDDRLKALEEILKNELGKDIRFVKRTVDRQVIVTAGTFEFRPLSGTYNDKWLHFFSDKLDTDEGSGGGPANSVADLLTVLGQLTGMQVIDTTESSEANRFPLGYGHHNSAYLYKIKDPAEKAKKLDLLLTNLAKQTNLNFHTEMRPVEKWFVEEANSVPAGQGDIRK